MARPGDRADRADGIARAVGSTGFHAPPDADGRVEIGYRVEPEYRRQGVATEAVARDVRLGAREQGVDRFRASVSPDNVRVAGRSSRGLGFQPDRRPDRTTSTARSSSSTSMAGREVAAAPD